ncbi:hypothetical protein B7463_g7802, partial [Scytalidium lignicola]
MHFAIITLLLFSSRLALAATVCNGHAEFCSRSYSNVSQIGSHDSAFVGSLPTENQGVSVSDQLDNGIRFLQAQTHNFLGIGLYLCHTSCFELNAGPLTNYLTTIRTWMDSNPNEVVTLLLTNGDGVSVSEFGSAMTSSGLARYAYTPPSQLSMDKWPTLGELIDSGTRLVMFLDSGADTTVVPYILPEFNYFFETAYDVTDATFSSCALDRPGGSNGDGLMMIVNHFLDVDILGILIPDDPADGTTNAATGPGSIGAQADLCYSTWGRSPNFILVDYSNKDDWSCGYTVIKAIDGYKSDRSLEEMVGDTLPGVHKLRPVTETARREFNEFKAKLRYDGNTTYLAYSKLAFDKRKRHWIYKCAWRYLRAAVEDPEKEYVNGMGEKKLGVIPLKLVTTSGIKLRK